MIHLTADLREKVVIDFSLIPNKFLFYSGIFFKVIYSYPEGDVEKRIILADGGRIDNFLNQPEMKNCKPHPFPYKGFSMRFYTQKMFKIKAKINKLKKRIYDLIS